MSKNSNNSVICRILRDEGRDEGRLTCKAELSCVVAKSTMNAACTATRPTFRRHITMRESHLPCICWCNADQSSACGAVKFR